MNIGNLPSHFLPTPSCSLPISAHPQSLRPALIISYEPQPIHSLSLPTPSRSLPISNTSSSSSTVRESKMLVSHASTAIKKVLDIPLLRDHTLIHLTHKELVKIFSVSKFLFRNQENSDQMQIRDEAPQIWKLHSKEGIKRILKLQIKNKSQIDLPYLQQLFLPFAKERTTTFSQQLSIFLPEVYTKLTSCDLSDRQYTLRWFDVTNDVVVVLAQRCINLVALNLNKCESLWDPALLAIANGCHNLKSLDLEDVRATRAGLLAIADGCPKMEFLNLRIPISSVNDDGILAADLTTILQKCSKLVSIKTYKLRTIDEPFITALRKRFPQLNIELIDLMPRSFPSVVSEHPL